MRNEWELKGYFSVSVTGNPCRLNRLESNMPVGWVLLFSFQYWHFGQLLFDGRSLDICVDDILWRVLLVGQEVLTIPGTPDFAPTVLMELSGTMGVLKSEIAASGFARGSERFRRIDGRYGVSGRQSCLSPFTINWSGCWRLYSVRTISMPSYRWLGHLSICFWWNSIVVAFTASQ